MSNVIGTFIFIIIITDIVIVSFIIIIACGRGRVVAAAGAFRLLLHWSCLICGHLLFFSFCYARMIRVLPVQINKECWRFDALAGRKLLSQKWHTGFMRSDPY